MLARRDSATRSVDAVIRMLARRDSARRSVGACWLDEIRQDGALMHVDSTRFGKSRVRLDVVRSPSSQAPDLRAKSRKSRVMTR